MSGFCLLYAMPLACWAKKARLAFAMLLEMLTDGERSYDHATPRQTALREEEIVESPTAIDSTLRVREDECDRNSILSWRPFF